ncbi:MAG: YqgE/AlgH family protein [Alphaproteobacteria bacterium]|nr:YqgE/AlgH family protein [Alphaproteobacteria bacterium]MCB9930531.1 YqgE/AlgH family protein [Alphaproteobacteria bacterium]
MSKSKSASDASLTGRFLIAMPHMGDPRFARSVVFLCAHGDEGAMGLIVNKEAENITFNELLEQLEIEPPPGDMLTVQNGGPVESGRGFVLHSRDYFQEGSVRVTDDVILTATVEVLRSIAGGEGPRRRLLALGYAGWGQGQLESEIQANGWLVSDADDDILFSPDLETKWTRALAKLGVDPAALSGVAGRA